MKSSTAIAVVAVLALFVVYWFYTRPAEEAPETLVVEEVQPQEVAEAPAPPPTPAPAVSEAEENVFMEWDSGTFAVPQNLNDSDEKVEAALTDLAPSLNKWLAKNERVRRFVMNVSVMSDNGMPEKYPFLVFPMSPFKVSPAQSGSDTFMMDPVNYQRAEPLVDAVTAVPAKKLVAYYMKWQPTLDEAYTELGRSGSFSSRVNKALDLVIAAKPAPQNAVLVRESVYYQYQDPKLEKAGRIEKWLWRMGAENQMKLKAYAKQLKAAMAERAAAK